MPTIELTQGIQLLRDTYAAAGRDLEARHPGWDRDRDARLAFFWRVHGIAQTALVLTAFQTNDLHSPEWWKGKFDRVPSAEDRAVVSDEVMRFVGVGLFHAIFSVMETSLRSMVREGDPAACEGGAANFESIYSWVVARSKRKRAKPMFNLMRLVRNTVHNNGAFVSPKGKNESVRFDNRAFDFRHMQVVDFRAWGFRSAWDFALPILLHLAREMAAIVESPDFAAPAVVSDPTLVTLGPCWGMTP